MKRIAKLDGLRGIFSLMIVLFHYDVNFIPRSVYNISFIRESYHAVDFFFVLSGFVISYKYNYINSFKNIWTYLKKRFIRLYPLLLYTSILFFSIDLLFNFFFPQYVSTVETFSALVKKFFDTILFTNSTPILGNTLGTNPPSWSISAEVISYIVFGSILILTAKKNSNYLFFSIIILGILFLAFKKWNGNINGDYNFIRGLISFNVGYFVWVLSHKKLKIKNIFEYIIPIALYILLYISFNATGFLKETMRLTIIPLFFGFSILILLKTNGIISRILETKIFKFLGDISYSVYLNHFLIILLIPKGIFTIFKFPQSVFTELVVLFLTLAIIIAYSFFTYRTIEIKGKNLLKRLIL